MGKDVSSKQDQENSDDERVALIAGETLTKWPNDLYIPPDALEIVLEDFEGPLDLLLYLIRRQNINILDLPVANITKQYMQYIELMNFMRLDLAADYLVMATILTEIKSRMLLPRPESTEDDSEDPRVELIKRLQEYEIFKDAAQKLDARPRLDRDLYLAYARIEDPEPNNVEATVDMNDLVEAMRKVIIMTARRQNLHVNREALSVKDRMSQILEKVRGGDYVSLSDFFSANEGRQGLVVSFIAVLELVRDRILVLSQNEPFSIIHVKAKI